MGAASWPPVAPSPPEARRGAFSFLHPLRDARARATVSSVSHSIRVVRVELAAVVAEAPKGEQATTAQAVFSILAPIIGNRAKETFCALLLDGRHRVTGYLEVSVGTLTSSLVHPREVYGPALALGAAAIVVAHNHPSGNPEPSPEDWAVTERLREAGKLLGVPLLDHVVIGDACHASLRDLGAFDES